MKIERKTAGNVTILTFTGEFDAFNVQTVGEGIDTLIQKGERSRPPLACDTVAARTALGSRRGLSTGIFTPRPAMLPPGSGIA